VTRAANAGDRRAAPVGDGDPRARTHQSVQRGGVDHRLAHPRGQSPGRGKMVWLVGIDANRDPANDDEREWFEAMLRRRTAFSSDEGR